MLNFLRIRNFAIVEDLALRLGEGLNLLTGETGAGKSILIDALGILLGDRASADLVRTGAASAEVEAVFLLPAAARGAKGELREMLGALGLEPEEDEVIVRREVELAAAGEAGTGGGRTVRSRQFLCDASVSVGTLKRFGEAMVEIQGQHQHHDLLQAEAQREALDRFAGAGEPLETMRRLAREANGAAADLAALEERARDREARLEVLRFQLADLDALAPGEGEEAGLRTERTLVQSVAERLALAEAGYRALYEEDASVLGALGAVSGRLRKLVDLDAGLERIVDKMDEARRGLEDVALELRDYRDGAEIDPGRLEEIEDRLARYDRLARRHGVTPAELPAEQGRLREEQDALARHEERIAVAREAARSRREAALEAARALGRVRREAAARLRTALRRELASLAMEGCEVEIAVEGDEPAPLEKVPEDGVERVEIRIAPNPGEPPRALATVASGGELCRVMLAVNAALGAGRRRRTLVFDEVDSGIGGRVAEVVGETLRRLSSDHQVVAITHLPQIAALASRHYVVEKKVERGRTRALVRELDREGRVTEIARMMAGKEVSEVARRHAVEMLDRAEAAGRPEEPGSVPAREGRAAAPAPSPPRRRSAPASAKRPPEPERSSRPRRAP